MIEPVSKSSFLGNRDWRGAINLAEWLGDRLSGGGGRFSGKSKNCCLEVVDGG